MNNIQLRINAGIFIKIGAILYLITQFGCAYEHQTINGRVVDESGVGISNVEVRACYSGWGWSSGGLVWDKGYCSEPVMTDNTGAYVISFKGPESMSLMARKEGWIQTQDFSTKASHIILTNLKVYLAREADREGLHEKKFRARLPGESDTEYYCRVIMERSGKITIEYKGQEIKIVQRLIKYHDLNSALFALLGSYEAASSLANEAVLKINGKVVDRNFTLRSDVITCPSDVYFIEVNLPNLSTELDKRIGILIPKYTCNV